MHVISFGMRVQLLDHVSVIHQGCLWYVNRMMQLMCMTFASVIKGTQKMKLCYTGILKALCHDIRAIFSELVSHVT